MAQMGKTHFSFTTSDARELEVEATVYFNSDGEPEVDSLILSENDEDVEVETLLEVDRKQIEAKACFKAEPQDEVYDEYEDLDFES